MVTYEIGSDVRLKHSLRLRREDVDIHSTGLFQNSGLWLVFGVWKGVRV